MQYRGNKRNQKQYGIMLIILGVASMILGAIWEMDSTAGVIMIALALPAIFTKEVEKKN